MFNVITICKGKCVTLFVFQKYQSIDDQINRIIDRFYHLLNSCYGFPKSYRTFVQEENFTNC